MDVSARSTFAQLNSASSAAMDTDRRTAYLELSEGRLAYDDVGVGETLLLLPGAGDLRGEYRFLAPQLEAAGYRVVTADLRGHGDSDATFRHYGVPESAADILALIDHLDAEHVTVVATSFSPAAALWAAAEAPEKIMKLVLISPHLTDDATLFEKGLLEMALRGPFRARVWNAFYKSWYPSRKPADLEDYARRLSGMLATAERSRAVRQTLSATREGLAARLPQVAAPVLVIMGAKDSHFKNPAEEAAGISKEVAARTRIVEGAGHYPHAEVPEEAAPVILEFLRSS